MRKVSKKIVSFLLAACLLVGTSSAVMASEVPAESPVSTQMQIQPRWALTGTAECGLSDDGNNSASVYYYLVGNDEVTKVIATATVQKENANGTYSNYKSLGSKTFNGSSATFTGTTSIVSGSYYRLAVTFKVYAGSKTETVTVYG